MSIQTVIFLLLGIMFLFLASVNVVLLLRTRKNDKKIDELLEGGKLKDFKSVLLSQKKKNENLEEKIREALEKIKTLEDVSEMTFQKMGVVRFNPFNGMGGNQSFVIALLDNKNNGFIISSLFVKDGNRVYAKIIKQGKSDYPMSQEEIEAVSRATSLKQ
jgi:cell division protein FtsB